MAQLLIAAIIVGLLAYFAFSSHDKPAENPAPAAYSSEVDQARQAAQGGTYEMKKAREAEQLMQKGAESKQENIDYQSGMASPP